jgi:cytochrome c5
MSQQSHDAAHDKEFFDTFMLVLGILVGVTIALIFLGRAIAAKTQVEHVKADAVVMKATADRIAPVAKVAISGQDNSALEPQGAAPAAAVDLAGDEAYTQACAACHGSGLAGAPKFGDKGAWAARIAQGMPTLYKHAIEGFQGKAGFMPAKGGRADFSDKTITNAVDHLVAGSK